MNYTFDSIAGYEREKTELKNLCEIFSNRKKYEEKGGRLPKGIIFYGRAGTGKTLFAKVLASECGLKIKKVDLGDATRESSICRQLKRAFSSARKSKVPTMIFFDELDKLLPNDDEEYYTDRSKSILAQLLTLIDGMDSTANIVFVATCNSYGSLPETLVRPGRIDKKISIGRPTYTSRIEIINMYISRSSCRFGMKAEEMARMCSGFSCAALETLINESVLHSDDNNFASEELIRAVFSEIKNEDISRKGSQVEDVVYACRNIGLLAVARELNHGEYVLSLEEDTVCNDYYNKLIAEIDDDYEDDYDGDDEMDECEEEMNNSSVFCRADLMDAITVIYGGYAAEEIVLNKTYDNLYYQLRITDCLMQRMLEMGMLGVDMQYREARARDIPYSPDHIDQINEVMDKITSECYCRAKELVLKNKQLIKSLIPHLLERRTIDKKDCEALIEDISNRVKA